jgi:hypothetical protein
VFFVGDRSRRKEHRQGAVVLATYVVEKGKPVASPAK